MSGLTYGTYGAGTALAVIGLCKAQLVTILRTTANLWKTCCSMARARPSMCVHLLRDDLG